MVDFRISNGRPTIFSFHVKKPATSAAQKESYPLSDLNEGSSPLLRIRSQAHGRAMLCDVGCGAWSRDHAVGKDRSTFSTFGFGISKSTGSDLPGIEIFALGMLGCLDEISSAPRRK